MNDPLPLFRTFAALPELPSLEAVLRTSVNAVVSFPGVADARLCTSGPGGQLMGPSQAHPCASCPVRHRATVKCVDFRAQDDVVLPLRSRQEPLGLLSVRPEPQVTSVVPPLRVAVDLLAHELYRRRTESEVQRQERVSVVGRFASELAHDFNNYISPIVNYAEMGLEEIQGPSELGEYFARIRDAGRRAARLTARVLAFGRRETDESTSDLSDLVRTARPMVHSLVHPQTALVLELPPNVGAVRVDRTQLEQVLINLVVNADQAMPDGGQVRITTDRVFIDDALSSGHKGLEPGSWARITVSDTGMGMAPEVIEHVFEPYFTTKPTGKGTGLGLSSVMGIIKQHGGHIGVHSLLGHGTTFEILLPMVED